MKKFLLLQFLLFLCGFISAQPVPNSGSIMAAAYKKAAKENKNVFVIFHASWCNWCKKMDASLNDETVKKTFDENYVTVHLTVNENAPNKNKENRGADVFLKKYKGQNAGLPFFVIMDKKGKFLGDSFVNGKNLGCPASEEEVAAFITLLKKTSKINEERLQVFSSRFRQNETK